MTVQTEYEQAYHKRLAAIEADPQLTVLSSMNQPQESDQMTCANILSSPILKPMNRNKNQLDLRLHTV